VEIGNVTLDNEMCSTLSEHVKNLEVCECQTQTALLKICIMNEGGGGGVWELVAAKEGACPGGEGVR
jgi:hypothetical protein